MIHMLMVFMTKLSVCMVLFARLWCYPQRLVCRLRLFAQMCLMRLGTAKYFVFCSILSNTIIRTTVYSQHGPPYLLTLFTLFTMSKSRDSASLCIRQHAACLTGVFMYRVWGEPIADYPRESDQAGGK